MKIRKVLLTLCLFAAAFSVFPARAAQTPKGEISFYYFGDKAEEAAYNTVIEGFNKKYPDVKVKSVVLPSGDDYLKKLTADFAARLPPDVFLINYREYVAYAKRDLIEPVEPYLAKSTILKKGDFYEAPVQAFTRDGALQCMAQNLSSLAVYYNKDLFKKANLAAPTPDWTWDDFLKAAQALTNDTGDPRTRQYGAGIQVQFYRVMPFIWSNGGEIVDNLEKPTKLLIDSPEAKAALQWFADLQVKHKVMPTEVDEKSESSQNRFLAGKLGMFLQSRRFTTTARTIKDFDWDVINLPRSKTSVTVLHTDGFCLSKGGTNKDAAWAFVEYAASAEAQTTLAATGRIVPANKSVANSPAFLDPNAKPANAKIFLDMASKIRLSPNTDNWADIESELNRMIAFVFYGDKTVDQAVEEAIRNTAQFLK
jgi:multiple sugar transport system substrate-binding protein